MQQFALFGARDAHQGLRRAHEPRGKSSTYRPRGLTSLDRMAILAAVILLGGCHDTTSPDISSLGRPSAGRPSADVASDNAINYGDTWVSETDVVAESTTVTSSGPFLDPTTQQNVTTLTLGTENESISVLAGYGYDGQARVTTGYDTSNPLATGLVRQVGDATYDASAGQSLGYGTFDVEPIATLGTMQNAQLDPTDPCANAIDVELCREGQDVVPAQRPTLASSNRMPGRSAMPRISRVQIDATHIRVVADAVDGSALSAPLSAAVSSISNSTASTHRRAREYEKRGNDWVLIHIMDETVDTGAGRSIRFVLHQSLTNVNYFRNAQLDAARRSRRAAADSVRNGGASHARAPRNGPSFDTSCDATSATLIIACDEPTSGGGGVNSGDPPAPNQTIVSSGPIITAGNGGGVGVILQHGFNSSSATWARMQNWLNTDMRHSGIKAPTTTWQHTYEDQETELKSNVTGQFGAGSVVLIGHSNGGMISRYLSQQEFGHGAIGVQGVITLGTPHQGTPVANVAGSLVRLLGFGGPAAFLLCHYTDTAGCINAGRLSAGMYGQYSQYTAPIPVLTEMMWHDTYHAGFNAVPESFQRFGISSQMWVKWQLWREWGDTYCYEDSDCGGSAQVAKVDRIYHHDLTCMVISGLFFSITDATKCASDAVFLRALDLLSEGYLKGPSESINVNGDAAVPLSSQQYPNVPSQNLFTITDGPAHWGETSDARVKQIIESVLQGLGINPKQ